MEPEVRIELTPPNYKLGALPLSYTGINSGTTSLVHRNAERAGFEPAEGVASPFTFPT